MLFLVIATLIPTILMIIGAFFSFASVAALPAMVRLEDNNMITDMNVAKASFFKYDNFGKLIDSPIGKSYDEIRAVWGIPDTSKRSRLGMVYTWEFGWRELRLEFDIDNKQCINVKDDGILYGNKQRYV